MGVLLLIFLGFIVVVHVIDYFSTPKQYWSPASMDEADKKRVEFL